jgi:hypothetical protein
MDAASRLAEHEQPPDVRVRRSIDEPIVPGDRLKTMLGDLPLGRHPRHLVMTGGGVPRLAGVTRATIDDDQPRADAHRCDEGPQDRLWGGQLVIGVCDQHRIDRSGWQPRVVGGSANDVEVPMSVERRADPQEGQRLSAKVDRDDATIRRHARCDLQREVASARAQIDDGVPRLQIELFENLVRALPGIALALHGRQDAQRSDGLIADEEKGHTEDDRYEDADCPFHRARIFCHEGSAWPTTPMRVGGDLDV